MEPTKLSGPPTVGQPLVEFVRSQRRPAAYLMLALAAAFLVGSATLAIRALRKVPAPADASLTATPDAPKPPEGVDVKRGDYVVGWIGTLAMFLTTATAGAWLLVGLPHPDPDRQRTEARLMLLAVGGALGLVLIAAGMLYFYRWSDSLAKWLDKGDVKESRWVVIPLLLVVAGAGLVLAAIQPARAEERNNTVIRKTVYWSNFALTVLLLVVGVVVANVIFALKVPNKLDTTESGFYTLGESTKAFLTKLEQPVTCYVVMPDSSDRLLNDIRQLALSCQDASEGKFKPRFISPVADKRELAALREKHNKLKVDPDGLGILLTTGADESRHTFIPLRDLFKSERGAGGKSQESFDGENQVVKELRFLVDNEQKPVIYFTQSNGELSIGGGGAEAAIGGAAGMLKEFLTKNYLDVRPLTFDLQNPVVPADALVVVVAEPTTPMSPAVAAALKKYMTTPLQDARKGKLIVLAGAAPGADGKGVAKTGLEDLLAEFNVRLGDKYVYSQPSQSAPFQVATVTFSAASAQNPITQAISEVVRAFLIPLPREVLPLNNNPAFQAVPLLVTARGRATWLEDDRIGSIEAVIDEMNGNPAVAARKRVTDAARPVAVVVSEAGAPMRPGGPPAPGGAGRMVVIGNAAMVADETARRQRGTPVTFDLMAVAIDWLRDRPPVVTGIESKKYKEYQFPAPDTVDTTRLVWFPIGLGLLTVTGLGVALRVSRRR